MKKKQNKVSFLLLLLTALMLLTGCGKHECAICGEKADKNQKIENQNIDLCSDCYKTYIEDQQLFQEE